MIRTTYKDGEIISVNTRYYPSQFMPDGLVATVTVLVAGTIGDYAAYTGHGEPEWVAKQGDKIFFREASVHFAGLDEESYRS